MWVSLAPRLIPRTSYGSRSCFKRLPGVSASLIGEVQRKPEFRLIAKLLGLEVKDVPYVVTAFQFDAILVTADVRSILNKRGTMKQVLGLVIMSLGEFLKEP